jgi:hypothetical protein
MDSAEEMADYLQGRSADSCTPEDRVSSLLENKATRSERT